MLTFTDALGGALSGLGILEAELRGTYGDTGWELTGLDRTTFVVIAATMLEGLRSGGVEPEIDDSGHTRIPVWRALFTRA